jgi:hypothetical protein
MGFKSESIGRGGPGWNVHVHTVQDLAVGPDVIYAEGICTLYIQSGVRAPRIVTGEHKLDNRCCEIKNDKICFIRGREIYKSADYKAALQDILQKLVHLGMQNS